MMPAEVSEAEELAAYDLGDSHRGFPAGWLPKDSGFSLNLFKMSFPMTSSLLSMLTQIGSKMV